MLVACMSSNLFCNIYYTGKRERKRNRMGPCVQKCKREKLHRCHCAEKCDDMRGCPFLDYRMHKQSVTSVMTELSELGEWPQLIFWN
jgi:hypothetical protein